MKVWVVLLDSCISSIWDTSVGAYTEAVRLENQTRIPCTVECWDLNNPEED